MHTQLPARDAAVAMSASAAWAHVAVLASAVDARLDRWLADTYRIGLTEFRALGFLSLASAKELRVNDLAQRIGLNPSSTTRLVSRLEAKGLAHRDVCADDGRGVYAVIDERGEEMLREARSPYEARVRDLLDRPGDHFPQLATRQVGDALATVRDLVAS